MSRTPKKRPVAPRVAAVPTTGKRRAARHSAPAGSGLLRMLPSVPVLAGVATVAITAIGALSAVDAPAPTPAATSQESLAFRPASALSGSSATSTNSLLTGRGQDVSRDSSRDALADVVNAARATAARSIALIDSSKFGRHSLLTICRPEELDLLIVDSGLPPGELERYRSAGVSIEVADEIVPAT